MIRKALSHEAHLLTEISFSSKRYWDYPEEYMEIWKDELTLTSAYIAENEVFVHLRETMITGYYSLVCLRNDLHIGSITLKKGLWLDHFFITPKYIGGGIGRTLFGHCISQLEKSTSSKLNILADPNSSGFYEKMVCNYEYEYPSTIEGRTTPYFTYTLR